MDILYHFIILFFFIMSFGVALVQGWQSPYLRRCSRKSMSLYISSPSEDWGGHQRNDQRRHGAYVVQRPAARTAPVVGHDMPQQFIELRTTKSQQPTLLFSSFPHHNCVWVDAREREALQAALVGLDEIMPDTHEETGSILPLPIF